jgi:hypothetical protein
VHCLEAWCARKLGGGQAPPCPVCRGPIPSYYHSIADDNVYQEAVLPAPAAPPAPTADLLHRMQEQMRQQAQHLMQAQQQLAHALLAQTAALRDLGGSGAAAAAAAAAAAGGGDGRSAHAAAGRLQGGSAARGINVGGSAMQLQQQQRFSSW